MLTSYIQISVYVDIEGVGEVKDGVRCEFKKDSFDLTVRHISSAALHTVYICNNISIVVTGTWNQWSEL